MNSQGTPGLKSEAPGPEPSNLYFNKPPQGDSDALKFEILWLKVLTHLFSLVLPPWYYILSSFVDLLLQSASQSFLEVDRSIYIVNR